MYVCMYVYNVVVCFVYVASKVRCIYPKDYEISDELKKQIPMFVWPMRTLK